MYGHGFQKVFDFNCEISTLWVRGSDLKKSGECNRIDACI